MSPNLLIVHTDQQNCWTLGAYGGRLVETPNIDRRHDPDQLRNLAREASLARVLRDLAARVVEHNRRLESPAMRWLSALSLRSAATGRKGASCVLPGNFRMGQAPGSV